ncbi:MAG TPA: hypothetical protein VMH20_13150 [Verrucomicrobiae bacterium]|nr:hypothetical protein [Verrucomicrobiae bacterium]
MRIAAMVVLAMSLVACGGTKPPTPPTGKFSNASLNGQYAFLMSGIDLSGGYFAQSGSFTADGDGHITGGLEDVVQLSTGQPATTVAITGGNYQVQSNGNGTMTLNYEGGSLGMSFVLQSTSSGYAVQTDLNAATNGSFNLQSSANFTAGALATPYVFNLYGVSLANAQSAPISMIGQVVANGSGVISSGLMDTNGGNPAAASGATPITPGTYALDTNGNGTNFGRGMMTFNGRTYAFYIVDNTHFKMVEEDKLGGSAGEALQQTASIPTKNSQFTGGFVYLTAGASTLGTEGPDARVARFTSDGNGNIGAVSLDDNNNGKYTHISQGGNISAATYAIDTANAGSGRGGFTFAASGDGTFVDVFYMISSTQGVVQELSKGLVSAGPIYAQNPGPFTLSGSAGTFVTDWSGVQLGGLGSSTAIAPFQEEFVGQYVLANTSSSNIGGQIDYVEFGLTSKTLFPTETLAGTLTIHDDGTTNNHYQYGVNGSPSITVNFEAYFVNPQMLLMVTSDDKRTTSGIVFPQ